MTGEAMQKESMQGSSPLLGLLIRRLGHAVLLLAVLSLLSFILADLAPGDMVSQLQLDPRVSADTVEQLRQRYGLDQPWHQRYVQWLSAALRGDLGYSLAHQLPVTKLLWPRLQASLWLGFAAAAVGWSLALLGGALAAWRPGSGWDRLLSVAQGVLLSVPDLLLALAALWLASRSGLFPLAGTASLDVDDLSTWQRLGDRLWHLALPAVTLGLAVAPGLAAHVRQALVEARSAPCVTAAQGHGLGGWRLFHRYTLRLAAPTLLHLAALSVASLVSGSLVIEAVLGWPGLGPMLLDAVLARDTHVVLAGALLSAGFLLLANLLADLATHHLDPRTTSALRGVQQSVRRPSTPASRR